MEYFTQIYVLKGLQLLNPTKAHDCVEKPFQR